MTYSCKDRAPLRTRVVVADGWFQDGYTRTPKMISIPDPMTKTCQYSKFDIYNDPQCQNCKHKEPK